MKDLFKNIKFFFTSSNRTYHLLGGFAIMVAMMLAFKVVSANYFHGAYIGFVASALTMLSLEFKDWKAGGIFDWKDIVAGMIVPTFISIVVLCEFIFG